MDLIQDSQKHLNAMDLRLAALQGATGEWGNPAAILALPQIACLFLLKPGKAKGRGSDRQKGTVEYRFYRLVKLKVAKGDQTKHQY